MNSKEPTRNHFLSVAEIADVLGQRQPGIMGEKHLGRFSVLVPLVERDDGTLEVLFEKRARTMRRQAGEICFPGGRAEEGDASPWETARRETSEELGLAAKRIRQVGTLDTVVTPFACIYPFVGQIDSLADMSPNPAGSVSGEDEGGAGSGLSLSPDTGRRAVSVADRHRPPLVLSGGGARDLGADRTDSGTFSGTCGS